MVNTFLVCSPEEQGKGYRISASKLDFKRLNKQITEALQILNLVESFHVLGNMFKDPVPNDYKCHAWIRKIKKKYDALDVYVFLHQGKYVWWPKNKDKPKKLKYSEKYQIKGRKIIYNGKEYDKYGLVLPGDNLFTLGFWSHPSVIMFLNYPDSLKLYINAHIDEFIFRGGKTSISRKCKIEKNVKDIVHPPWALDPKFHENHKASLLTKEIDRNEKSHYIHFKDFVKAYNKYFKYPEPKKKSTSSFNHYIWPFSQDLENPIYK